MWFGDLVTMKWWDDLWLKESFATWAATFAASEALEDATTAWSTFSNGNKNWAYRQDQLPSTHPIAADMVDLEAIELNFDGITYAKGASVLVQLVAFVGQDAFLKGLRTYFAEHAFGNTELADLLRALERASGRDLSHWSGGVAGDRRGQHSVGRFQTSTPTAVPRSFGSSRRRTRPIRYCAVTGSRSGSTLGPRNALQRSSEWRPTSPVPPPRFPNSTARRSPTCCCRTTTI